MNQFSLSCASNRVNQLAALAQALIALGSPRLSQLPDEPEQPEQPEQDLPHRHVFQLLAFYPIILDLISVFS